MSEQFVWNNFCRLFPEKVDHVIQYKRAGSKMITMEMDDGSILWFLYHTPINWNFGTKPWRAKPTKQSKEIPSECSEE